MPLTAYRYWRISSGRAVQALVYRGAMVFALLALCATGAEGSDASASAWGDAAQVGSPEAIPSSRAETAARESLRVDNRALDVRAPGDERFEAYEADDTYDYIRETPPEEDQQSLIGRLLKAFLESITATAERRAVVDVVLYGLVALAIGYGLLAIIRMEPRASKHRATSPGYQSDGLDERVKETAFEPLIDQAINEGEYRSALRLMYLHGLQQLDRSDWINWRPDRTNLQYERSLTGTAVGPSFREATRIFDVVWYGDVRVRAAEFDDLRRPFDEVRDYAEGEREGGSGSQAEGEEPVSTAAKPNQPTTEDAGMRDADRNEPTSEATASRAGGDEG